MLEQLNWQASANEHRTAWIIAASCLLLIFIASLKPDLFELSQESEPASISTEISTKADPEPLEELPPLEETIVQAQQKVKQIKPTPPKAVIQPKPVRKEVTTKKEVNSIASGYYVQLGAFKEKPRAQGLVDQLKRQGWQALISSKANGLHAVWAGPKRSRTEIDRLQKAIEKKLKTKGFIVQQKGA